MIWYVYGAASPSTAHTEAGDTASCCVPVWWQPVPSAVPEAVTVASPEASTKDPWIPVRPSARLNVAVPDQSSTDPSSSSWPVNVPVIVLMVAPWMGVMVVVVVVVVVVVLLVVDGASVVVVVVTEALQLLWSEPPQQVLQPP